jgi:hypothetical protein
MRLGWAPNGTLIGLIAILEACDRFLSRSTTPTDEARSKIVKRQTPTPPFRPPGLLALVEALCVDGLHRGRCGSTRGGVAHISYTCETIIKREGTL